jgi:hypothetical protein
MFKKLINWLTANSQQSSLEAYIISKNPQSAADVDYWTREYDKHVWARGL